MIATLWPSDAPVARFLICVIVVLLAWALACTVRHVLRLAREGLALGRVAARLGAWRQANLELAGAGEAAYPRLSLEELRSKLVELQNAAGRGTHVAMLVDSIHKLRSHRVKVNLATLQQLVEHDEATRIGASAPQYVANFAIMIGILGTFWGVGHMVRAIGVALPERGASVTPETWTHSLGQIRTVLDGMRTSFSTSLVGIATAIASGLCGVVLASCQQRLLKAIESFAVNDLLPATVPTLEDDSVLEQVSGQLETAFTRIDGIAAQNLASIQELTAAQTTFRALIEDIRAIAHGEASRDLDRVLASVVGSNEALVQLLPSALEARHDVEAVRTMLASTNEALRELAAALPRRFEAEHRTPRGAAPVVDAAWPQPQQPPEQPPSSRASRRLPQLRRVSTVLVAGLLVFGIGFVVMLAVLN